MQECLDPFILHGPILAAYVRQIGRDFLHHSIGAHGKGRRPADLDRRGMKSETGSGQRPQVGQIFDDQDILPQQGDMHRAVRVSRIIDDQAVNTHQPGAAICQCLGCLSTQKGKVIILRLLPIPAPTRMKEHRLTPHIEALQNFGEDRLARGDIRAVHHQARQDKLFQRQVFNGRTPWMKMIGAVDIGSQAGHQAHFADLAGAALVTPTLCRLSMALPGVDFRRRRAGAKARHIGGEGVAEVYQGHGKGSFFSSQVIKKSGRDASLRSARKMAWGISYQAHFTASCQPMFPLPVFYPENPP